MATLVRGNGDYSSSLVIAIDFGTTYSGYAFSMKPKERDIFMYTKWGECASIPGAFKAPTCVLTSVDGQFEAFGYEAQQKYSECSEEEAKEYCFYDKFKMYLHQKTLNRATFITASSGQIKPALDIFAMVLKYLRGHALHQIEQQTGSLPKAESIQWVVTVPAIWSEASKQFMREAACMGSLIDKMDSNQLLISLEPEAASIYCLDCYTEMSSLSDISKAATVLPPGTKYLLLDCGGGTVDVAAHKLSSNGKISEVTYATGGSYGGMMVDKNIKAILKEIFGEPVIEHFQAESPGEWLSMCINMERLKHTVDPKSQKRKSLSMPFQLSESFKTVTRQDFRNAITENYKEKGISMPSGTLRLPYAILEERIKPVTDGIVSHVEELLKKQALSDIRHFLVVGGFGQCPLLLHALKDRFGPEYTFIVPAEANGCVLKGAVMFGHNPSIISGRKARMTIGCNYNPPFDASRHDPSRIVEINGKQHAENAFFPFITKGRTMKAGSQISTTFSVTSSTTEIISISLFETADKSPMYVEEQGVSKLGTIDIKLPTSSQVRQIELIVKFGGTEIEVEARDPSPGGDIAKATIDFLSY